MHNERRERDGWGEVERNERFDCIHVVENPPTEKIKDTPMIRSDGNEIDGTKDREGVSVRVLESETIQLESESTIVSFVQKKEINEQVTESMAPLEEWMVDVIDGGGKCVEELVTMIEEVTTTEWPKELAEWWAKKLTTEFKTKSMIGREEIILVLNKVTLGRFSLM